MDFRLRAKQLKVHTTGNKHTNKQTNQFCRGQITLEAVAEHVSKQLHGQRTYFLPGGGAAIG